MQNISDKAAFVGPPLSDGALPAFFYFALSAQDSLSVNPFNQIVDYLSAYPLRIFSVTLPSHEEELSYHSALQHWAEALLKGENPIARFVDEVDALVQDLLTRQVLLKDHLAIGGLSRGGFAAVHVAAKLPFFSSVLAFAPITKLHQSKEFASLEDLPLVRLLNLETLTPSLIHHHIRCYIGNLDTRTHTRSCFDWIESLTHAAAKEGVRSPPMELIITPSIGRDGHGTSKETFHQGAQWILKQLGVPHAL